MLKSWWVRGTIGLLALIGISSTFSKNTTLPTPEVKSLTVEAVATSTPIPTIQPTTTLVPTATLVPTSTPTPTPESTQVPTLRPTARPTLRPTAVPTAVPATKTSGSSGYYTNVDGQKVQSPVFSETIPDGASAKCRDGSYSFSTHRSGTCSGHGGVATWY